MKVLQGVLSSRTKFNNNNNNNNNNNVKRGAKIIGG